MSARGCSRSRRSGLLRCLRGRGAANYSTRLPEAVARELNDMVTATTLTEYRVPTKLWTDWIVRQMGSIPNPLQTIANDTSVHVKQKMQRVWHPLHSALHVWSKCHLANGILSCLGNHTEMAHSIEARTPLLDHEFTGYAKSLPPSVKLRYEATTGVFCGEVDPTRGDEAFRHQRIVQAKEARVHSANFIS